MYARVTQFEIDLVRLDGATAVERFRQMILPGLQRQPGYAGVYALLSDEGKGSLITLWESEAAADASVVSGFYDEQLAKFVTFFRSPPGREHYAVVFAEGPHGITVPLQGAVP
jgi:heme-degrading monooxygenase HmoA